MLNLFTRSEEAIKRLNPDRIYVENVRAILGTTRWIAQKVCDVAVEMGYFKKRYAVNCPNSTCGRVIVSADSLEQLQHRIKCELCEENYEDECEWSLEKLDIETYYVYQSKSYEVA